MEIIKTKDLVRSGSRGKVIVGMSGGVDSAVTAYLLRDAGYEVAGVTLQTWESAEGVACRGKEIDAAKESAEILGIPLYVQNCAACFREYVSQPFVREYLSARTPNPCVECNRYVKWNGLLQMADSLGAAYVATGHYAFTEQLPNGRWTIRQAAFAGKDQTYVLFRLTQEQLSRTLMPLGAYDKAQVREIARKAGLPAAHKADSQEICFVAEGSSYAEYIAANAETKVPGPGCFIDEEGRVIGTHKGIIHYTVGQRKGLGLPLGYHAYVKEIRQETNEVVISREDAIFSRQISCDRLNFMSIPEIRSGEEIPASVRIRYHHAGTPAVIRRTGEDEMTVVFEVPVRAATPGQSAVCYDESGRIIGGGRIMGIFRG